MSPSTRRRPLDRATVITAAMTLADREGLDAVSMRRVAELVGVVPMALYKHVADKEDLLDGMVDAVIGGFPHPEGRVATEWSSAIREIVLGARHELTAHPWARRAIETRTRRTPAVLGHMEAITRILLAADFSPDLTHHVMHALGNRIWGFSPELFPETETEARRPARPEARPDPADYPAIMAIAADARGRRPEATGCDEDFEFGFALDLVLDAAERLRDEGWSSRL